MSLYTHCYTRLKAVAKDALWKLLLPNLYGWSRACAELAACLHLCPRLNELRTHSKPLTLAGLWAAVFLPWKEEWDY